MIEAESKRRAALRVALTVLAVLLAVGLAIWGLRALLSGKGETPRKPPKISLLPDRPPPPPPPRERPEPPKAEQKEVKTEVPKEPQPQTQNEPLKMEGAAGDGPSAFAAGTVGKEYSGGPAGGAIGGGVIGGNRMQHGLFADLLQRHLQAELNRNRKLRETDYRVNLRLWIARDGTVRRADLAQSTGNKDVDALLMETLLQVAAMRESPPEDLQQPIRIRVTARGGR